MADQNYLYATRQNPFNSFLQGFQGGQGIITNMARNSLMQVQEERMKIMTAMKLHDEMKGLAFNNLDYYNNQYRPAMKKIGVPDSFLPEFKDVQELNAGLYRNEQMKAALKAKMEGPKVVPQYGSIYEGGEFKYPNITPAQNALLEQKRLEEEGRMARPGMQYGYQLELERQKHGHRLTELEERAKKAPREWQPLQAEDEEGNVKLVPNVPGTVLPGGAANRLQKQRELAANNATKELANNINYNSLDPQSPEAIAIFNKTYEKHLSAIKGGAKQKNGSPEAGKKVVRTGTYNGRRVKQYSDGSVEYGD